MASIELHYSERSFSGKILQPKPVVDKDEAQVMWLFVTSWGSAEGAQFFIQEFKKYAGPALGDLEVTSPFPFLPTLSKSSNVMRVAAQIANEALYRNFNRAEYTEGIEFLSLVFEGRQLSWCQLGQPSLWIKSPMKVLSPITVGSALSTQNVSNHHPLPSDLIGMDPTCSVTSGDYLITPGQQLLVYSGNEMSEHLFMLRKERFDLLRVTKAMSGENPDTPFWLALLDL